MGSSEIDLSSLHESIVEAVAITASRNCVANRNHIKKDAGKDEAAPTGSYLISSMKSNEECLKLKQGTKDDKLVPTKQLLMYLVRMGSFTSKSVEIPAADTDNDINLDGIGDKESLLKLCSDQLRNLPSSFKRSWRYDQEGTTAPDIIEKKKRKSTFEKSFSGFSEEIRVLQWNALSQTLGTKNDNFVKCPSSALDWKTRRFRILEEIIQYDADIICLQEVDHFEFLKRALGCLGYDGHFFPKPDSPCIYLPENSGPDGCAIFYRSDRFDLQKIESRVIEVWRVQSNQVVLALLLRSKLTGEEMMVATTHLKARSGALLSTLRNEQGKFLLDFLRNEAKGRPIIITGDFNAEPSEPVYETMKNGLDVLNFKSAYAELNDGQEVPYTTWKIREDGEHIETLDYIFHTPERFEVQSILEFPEEKEIGENRLPSNRYASDHFSLACNFKLLPTTKSKMKSPEKLEH